MQTKAVAAAPGRTLSRGLLRSTVFGQRSATSGPQSSIPPSRLGYRGLRVTGLAGRVAGCESIRIAGGRVDARGERGARGYPNPDRRLERWLVETAAGRIDPGVLELLRAELGG